MGFMQRFERKLEDAVGNTFARVFGGKIVPAEVEDALHREAARGLQNLNGHELAPNHYVLTVSESDEENLTSDTELTLNAFAKHLTGYIGEQGWETYGVVSVALESSPDLHTGQFRARSVIAPDQPDAPAPEPHASAPHAPRPHAPTPPNPVPPNPVAFPHPRPGAAQMPSEQYDAPRPRYQPQAYGEVEHQAGQQYPDTPYQEAPAQAYSERPQAGQGFPHQQRYSSEQHPDPRFQPPAHLYPPQQPQQPQRPQQPQQAQQPQQPQYEQPHYQQAPPQQHQNQPPRYTHPGYGYQDQAYAGQEYPLRDTSSNYYADDRYAAPSDATQQQEWAPQNTTVVLELGDGSGRNLELRRGSNIIGRGQDAHFRIPDTGVSRQHADIQWDGAVALIVDLQSTNGTVVNDVPVNEWQLADGDVIRIGHSDITVHFH